MVGDVLKVTVTTPNVTGPPPDTVTVAINQPATFTATSTAGTTAPNPGWTQAGGPTYAWTVTSSPSATPSPLLTASPANLDTTTVSATYANAGTYSVTATCTVTYPAKDQASDPGILQGGGSKTITVYVIGGPITGKNDIHYYCDPGSLASRDWGHLSAADGQPADTTYSWSISGPAQLVAGATTPNATYAGKSSGSTAKGDVKATVTYSLNGVSTASPQYLITVHAPVNFTPTGFDQPIAYTSGPNPYGFDGQQIHFQITDGMGQLITNGAGQTVYWDEFWDITEHGNGPTPPMIGGPLDAVTAIGVDSFWRYQNPEPVNVGGDKVIGPLLHKYYVTDDGDGFAGGSVGCPVKTYTDSTYYTYRLIGNGFPQ